MERPSHLGRPSSRSTWLKYIVPGVKNPSCGDEVNANYLYPAAIRYQIRMQHDEVIPILDFGSQYAQLIARRVREKGVYSELVRPDISVDELKKLNPKGIILSGGPSSVYEPNAPQVRPEDLRPRRPDPRHLLRHAARRADPRRRRSSPPRPASTAAPSCTSSPQRPARSAACPTKRPSG